MNAAHAIAADLRGAPDRIAATAALHDLAEQVGGPAADDLRTVAAYVASGSLRRAIARLERVADRHALPDAT